MIHKNRRLAATAALVVMFGLAGPATLTASASDSEAAEVPKDLTPGEPQFGSNEYIEYIPGNLPVIFAAPHGGDLRPSTIPERTDERCGRSIATEKDVNTQELAREIQQEFFERTGKYPHIVINRLHRSKLDANRDIGEAACGAAEAERAWTEFHEFIEISKEQVKQDYDKGWFTDLHGHGHEVQRLELGYLLSGETLRQSDAELDGGGYESKTSFRSFSEDSPLSFSELLRGPTSLGTLFESAGYPATPSQADPAPTSSEPFFSGGYNTQVHGCLAGGPICGVQIEHNRDGVRDSEQQVADYAEKLYDVYDTYLSTNFGIFVQSPAQGVNTLRSEVEHLLRDGTLAPGHGSALLSRLDTARAQLDRDRPTAERALDAFRSRAESLNRSGVLEDGPATRISTLAKRVMQTLRASP